MVNVDLVKPEIGELRTAEKVRIGSRITESTDLRWEHWPVSNIDTVRSARGEGAEHCGEVGVIREYDLVALGTERKPVGRSDSLVESVSTV